MQNPSQTCRGWGDWGAVKHSMLSYHVVVLLLGWSWTFSPSSRVERIVLVHLLCCQFQPCERIVRWWNKWRSHSPTCSVLLVGSLQPTQACHQNLGSVHCWLPSLVSRSLYGGRPSNVSLSVPHCNAHLASFVFTSWNCDASTSQFPNRAPSQSNRVDVWTDNFEWGVLSSALRLEPCLPALPDAIVHQHNHRCRWWVDVNSELARVTSVTSTTTTELLNFTRYRWRNFIYRIGFSYF